MAAPRLTQNFLKKLLRVNLLCITKWRQMNDERSKAEKDLRVIRSLMERATIYRTISAPAALVAGLLSIVAAAVIYLKHATNFGTGPVDAREFAVIWLIVLALAVVANAFFLWREARKDSRPFISSGMKLALRAIAPNLLIPAAFTVWFFATGGYKGSAEYELVVLWIGFYGLALLSTGLFAPRSLVFLGWAFLLSGLAFPALRNVLEGLPYLPNLAMGVTFGLYHLVYAVCTWPRRRAGEIEQFAIE
jgi:hypothetical protein